MGPHGVPQPFTVCAGSRRLRTAIAGSRAPHPRHARLTRRRRSDSPASRSTCARRKRSSSPRSRLDPANRVYCPTFHRVRTARPPVPEPEVDRGMGAVPLGAETWQHGSIWARNCWARCWECPSEARADGPAGVGRQDPRIAGLGRVTSTCSGTRSDTSRRSNGATPSAGSGTARELPSSSPVRAPRSRSAQRAEAGVARRRPTSGDGETESQHDAVGDHGPVGPPA